MSYLLASIKAREKERAASFVCLGLVCVATQDSIYRHIATIMSTCKISLPAVDTPSKRRVMEPAVCICISLVARAVGNMVYTDVQGLLEPMMAPGLSYPLTVSLQSIAFSIPKLKRDIAEGLLKMLSLILVQRKPRNFNSPPSYSPVHQTNANLILALKTLGCFDFEGTGQTFLQFSKHICENYLTHAVKAIRLEAIPTCLHLIRPLFSLPHNQTTYRPYALFTIVNKVLWVCVTDTEQEVRLCVLSNMDEMLDYHLAQPDNFQALIYALSDENYEIRERALEILGRLSSINPSYIHPLLRKVLLKILDELEFSGLGRNRELSARLLGKLIGSAPRFMRQFVEPIMTVLVPKLKDKDPNPAVIMCILTAVGDLAQVSGTDTRKWLGDLMPFLIELLGDGTSGWKRHVALVTLGQLIESTGYVIHPYTQYPALLDILLSFIKTEKQPAVRRETLRVIGLIGALDPYKHKMNIGQIQIKQDTGVALICMTDNKNDDTSEMSTNEMLVNLNYNSLEEFYPACAIAVLMKVLKDPTLAKHQNDVVRSVTFIFQSLGVKGVPYLPRVIPSLLHVIRTSDASFRDFLFKNLSNIIDIVKQHIRNYLDDIVAILKEYWSAIKEGENAATIITVVESIALAVGTEFKMHLKDLVPLMVKSFINDSKEKHVTKRLLQALQKLGLTIEEFLHIIMPYIVKLFDDVEVPMPIRKLSVETVDYFAESMDLTDHTSQIIHPLLRALDVSPELKDVALSLLSSLVFQLGKSYASFVPVVQKVLNKHKINNIRYDILVAKVVKELPITDEERSIIRSVREVHPDLPMTLRKGTINVDQLQKAWSFTHLVSKEDWLEWLRRLSIELMKSSPSRALKACYSVATGYVQLSRDLFNAAFVSCWCELSESLQDDLLQSLKQALTSQDIPEITQTLLNLAEFMEHCDKGNLPLELQLLGAKAIECRAYAKALHYKEEEFHKGHTAPVLQSLISINTHLGQTEAAAGLLEFSRKNRICSEIMVQEIWFEKLHDWEKAHEVYSTKLEANPNDANLALGQMRCLRALGEWSDLYECSYDRWEDFHGFTDVARRQMAPIASAAAWAMGQWETMSKYANFIQKETQEGAFYRAVIAIHNHQFQLAHDHIEQARELLDAELIALVGESYQRAYNSIVNVQMLAELEEVIQYKLNPDRQQNIADMWWHRLLGCERVVENWQQILQVRSLALKGNSTGVADESRPYLKFSSMCRKSGRANLAKKTLLNLLQFDPDVNPDKILPINCPRLSYQYCKYLYTVSDRRDKAHCHLKDFVKRFEEENRILAMTDLPEVDFTENKKLISRMHLRLGVWQEELYGREDANLSETLSYLNRAKDEDETCYKAWHAFACTNFEAMLLYREREKLQQIALEAQAETEKAADKKDTATTTQEKSKGGMNAVADEKKDSVSFAIAAAEGFVRSISLSSAANSLQDTLRLLTICFDLGQEQQIYEMLNTKLKSIRIDNWLQVIPQLIARIDTPHQLVKGLIHQLLTNVGKQHPQALLYPLTVAAKSSDSSRTNAADIILENMREHSNELVNQAMMISEELIRVAILWHEKWYEGLEEASRLYFMDHNIGAMFKTLKPLHDLLGKGPITLKEMSFNQAYGRILADALDFCIKYQNSRSTRELNQAWDMYYQVFKKISRQLPQFSSLDLGSVSPRLHACKDLDIAVPGSYSPNSPINRISWIHHSIQVVSSKQKPRKLCIRGSDGHDYVFILKGHEDLRQDERVMQLFGLVNTLLVSNPKTSRHNLTIQRYAVIPLSTNSGLIGWVPNCDTLHVLIRDYRERKKILLTMEHQLMKRMAPDLDHLMLMQKVEVFEHALHSTKGDDLAKLLWFKSPSSEAWFDRRTNYTRSLAVMSMVGYMLGLGDRHPSNLMLHQMSGKIVHIDFGDCFEVAMAREKFPEKIPFRLTRMLVHAMEVTGIEGTYRMTCESVMNLLRAHKDSLMAMLEAFVYDPLLNWRLLKGPPRAEDDDTEDSRATEAANSKALCIVNRVKDKLTGNDFGPDSNQIPHQVQLLINQATSHENLCQSYVGWCPFW